MRPKSTKAAPQATKTRSGHTEKTAFRAAEQLFDRAHNWVIVASCILLAVITWVVFGQTLHHEFINYDDQDYVVKNAQVARGLTLEGVLWSFTHIHSANWHPLTWISHMIDCQFYGLDSGKHHLTNVLIHTTTAILLFLLLRQLTSRTWPSFFVAIVFAIHPQRAESVAWVSERKDLLSGLFFMLTLGAYTRYARAPSTKRYLLVTLLFVLGLMCKPMLVTLPIVLLLLDYWPLDRIRTDGERHVRDSRPLHLILEKLPLLALGIASSVVTLVAQRESMQPITKLSLVMRTGNAIVSYKDYLCQMVWPRNLAVLYPWDAAQLSAINVAVSILVVGGISASVFLLRERRYLVTGWLWYLLMLIPVIGIVQVGNQARADRYTYLPQIGLYILVAWGAADLLARWEHRRILLAAAASVIIVALAASARTQAAIWKDSETLWSHALATTTDNIIAEGNLGQACYDNGKKREAMNYFRNSLHIAPNQAPIHSSLGVLFLEMGRIPESLSHLQTAIELEPKFADAHYNLGNTYLEMGQAKEAVSQYRIALDIDPNDTEALNNMAWILATCPDALARDGAKAVELAERADSLTKKASPIASATLAAAYAEVGRFGEAVETGERAVRLANAEGNTARAVSIQAQIEKYQSGAAFRDHRHASGTP